MMVYKIEMYARIYLPWEDGADERELLRVDEDKFWFDGEGEAVAWLARMASEPSSWPWNPLNVPSMWYSGEGYENPYTGTLAVCTYHPCGCWSNGMHERVWSAAGL